MTIQIDTLIAKLAIGASTLIVAGFIGWLAKVDSTVSAQSLKIAAYEQTGNEILRRLDRMERKIDSQSR